MVTPTNYHEIQILKHEQAIIFQRLSEIGTQITALNNLAHDHKHYVDKPLKTESITLESLVKKLDNLDSKIDELIKENTSLLNYNLDLKYRINKAAQLLKEAPKLQAPAKIDDVIEYGGFIEKLERILTVTDLTKTGELKSDKESRGEKE